MVGVRIAEETAEVLEVDPDSFNDRVREDAEVVKRAVDDGTFDNPQAITGLEYEFYAIADPSAHHRWRADDDIRLGELRRIPRPVLNHLRFEKELGLHNAELNTSPDPVNEYGVRAQELAVRAHLMNALEAATVDGISLASDGIWTIPPAGESAREYLTDHVTIDELAIATNMSDVPRYHAMANSPTAVGKRLDLPNVELEAATVMPESLITSIQPHYQVPHAVDLPSYQRYGLRIAPPLLALAVNSPFLPPDLYDDVSDDRIFEDAWMEHRIRIFETSLNAPSVEKVRFPEDLSSVGEAIDRIAADPVVVPMPVEPGDRFDDRFAHFRTKHGTYWRWVRPVFEGDSEATANARIEFRPLPAQPTVRDSIAFQAALAGLLHGLHAVDHPVKRLAWETVRDDFYAAARDGLDAELHWIDAEGEYLTRTATIFQSLFETARGGLSSLGLEGETIDRYLAPLEWRVEADLTPAGWKHRRVAAAVADGAPLPAAITSMQGAYIRHQSETLLTGTFSEWVGA